ncbi:hypothetical protein JW905_00770 [bacterium]|nr:hypothetical protein [candidate division CSSED10-310 bacterium]
MTQRPLFDLPIHIIHLFKFERRTRSLAVAALFVCITAQPSSVRFIAGLVLALAGEGIRLWAAGTIEKRTSLTISGPYRYVRNPLYVGGGLIAAGLLVINGNIVALLVALLITAVFYPGTVRREEAFLSERFGEHYLRYSIQVRPLIPRLTPYQPADVERLRFSFRRLKRNHELDAVAALTACLLLLFYRLMTSSPFHYRLLVLTLFAFFWTIRIVSDRRKERRRREEHPTTRHRSWRKGACTYTLAIDAPSGEFIRWLEQLPGTLANGAGERIHDQRNRVTRMNLPGLHPSAVVCKHYSPGNPFQALRYAFFPTKAERAFTYANLLLERGFTTPKPVAMIVSSTRYGARESILVTEECQGMVEVRQVFNRPESPYASLLTPDFVATIASTMRRFHNQGLLHRDLSDGNVQFLPTIPEQLIFLDLNRMKQRIPIGLLAGVKDLVRLGVPEAYQRHFIETYLEDRTHFRILWRYYRCRKALFAGWIRFKKGSGLRKLGRRLGA